jgi:hypothetical protein
MERSRTPPAPATAAASTTALREQAYGDDLRDLREELLEPPEFVFSREPLRILDAGRARAIRDDAATWFD